MTDFFKDCKSRLEALGFIFERERDLGLGFVMTVVYDPVLRVTVGLRKTRGPTFLLNKITFPGGKIEEGESVEEAATRELAEEAGIRVPPEDWVFVARNHGLIVLAANSDKAALARPLTDEPVYVMSALQQLAMFEQNPADYALDFGPMLSRSIQTLTLS